MWCGVVRRLHGEEGIPARVVKIEQIQTFCIPKTLSKTPF
jgi:hypothetical protein